MALIVKQTLKHNKISFWKILLMIIITVVVMDLTIKFFSGYGAAVGSIAAIISLGICTFLCIKLIYKNLAYFNYRVIDDELMVERVIGKSNHIYFNINLRDIIFIKPYEQIEEDKKDIKTYKFVLNSDKEKWQVVEFPKDNKMYRIVLEPDDNFLKALNLNYEKVFNQD